MQHTNDAGLIYSRQSVKFIYDCHAFRFVIGTSYKVCNAIYHYQLNTPILEIIPVHALNNGVKSFFTGHTRKAESLKFIRLVCLFCPLYQVGYILEQLYFRLFRIIKQDDFMFCVLTYIDTQRINLNIRRTD